MRDGWEVVHLTDVVHLQNGYPFKPGELGQTGLPVIRIRELMDPSVNPDKSETVIPGSMHIDSGDVIFSWSGRLEVARWDRGPGLLNQHLFRVTTKSPAVDLGFAMLAIQHAIPRMQLNGTTMRHVTKRELARTRVPLPPLMEQRRIVDLIAALDDTIDAADPRFTLSTYHQFLADWMRQPGDQLDRALTPSSDSVAVAPDESYRILGVLRSGSGLIDRGNVMGSDIGYAKLTRVSANQLVYRKLTAWERPIAVSGPDEATGWVSSEFPVFDIDESSLLPDMLRHMCRWPGLEDRIKSRLVGTVQRRKRLNPTDFLEVRVPMPHVRSQLKACATLDALWSSHLGREKSVARLLNLRNNLLTVLLSGVHEIPASYDDLLLGVAA